MFFKNDNKKMQVSKSEIHHLQKNPLLISTYKSSLKKRLQSNKKMILSNKDVSLSFENLSNMFQEVTDLFDLMKLIKNSKTNPRWFSINIKNLRKKRN